MLDRLHRDHDRIRELATQLLNEFDRLEPGDMALLSALRWDMASTIMTHLAYEDRHLYARLENDPHPTISAVGRAFQSELRDAFAAYCDHTRSWTPECIVKDWDSYRTAAKSFQSWLLIRAMREETELYPLTHSIPSDRIVAMPVTTNWAREAFAMKDRIVGDVAA